MRGTDDDRQPRSPDVWLWARRTIFANTCGLASSASSTKRHTGQLLETVFSQSVDDLPPKLGAARRDLGIQSPTASQAPQELFRLDSQQAHLGDLGSRAAQFAGQHFQHERFAAARRTEQQPQASSAIDQEMQPGQRFFVRGIAVEVTRFQAVSKRRLVQTPMVMVHRRSRRFRCGIAAARLPARNSVHLYYSVRSAIQLDASHNLRMHQRVPRTRSGNFAGKARQTASTLRPVRLALASPDCEHAE